MEHAPNDKRAFYGSFVPVSTFSAFACAAVIAYGLEASLSSEAMNAWGWRIPFLIAAPLGLVGLYLRWRMEETPAFREAIAQGKAHEHSPLKETLRNHGRAIRNLGAFISLTALSFYMFTTYFATYLQLVGNLTRAQSLLVTTVALLFAAVGCPLAGAFSDRVGRRKTIAFTCLWVMLCVFPAYWLASSGSMSGALIGVILLAVGALCSGVVTAALLSESFPTRTRYTASAITYNVAYTLFGGTAPLVATWLIGQTGSSLAPAFYLVVIALVALVGGWRCRRLHGFRCMMKWEPTACSLKPVVPFEICGLLCSPKFSAFLHLFTPIRPLIQRRQHQQRQSSRRQNPANHHRRQRPLNLRPGPGRQGHRNEPQRRHQRGHQDWPQARQRALFHGRPQGTPFFAQPTDKGNHHQPVEHRHA